MLKSKKRILGQICAIAIVLVMVLTQLPAVVSAVTDFTGYTAISTKEELNDVRNDLTGKYYLTNDIVFEAADFAEGGAFYNDGAGWAPIGTDNSTPFTGIFDGNGYAIKGLVVNIQQESPADVYAGLFAANSGTIRNLGLEDGSVTGEGSGYTCYVGGITAYSENGVIENCYNANTISANYSFGLTYAGGIVAYDSGADANGNFGTVADCYNTGNISAFVTNSSSSSCYAGGIVGWGGCSITDCYNTGNISVSGTNDPDTAAGGIAAQCSQTITNCYNTGTINAAGVGNAGIGGIGSTLSNASDKSVSEIEITINPGKKEYVQGDTLDVTGGRVRVNYSDGTSEIIDMSQTTVTGFDSSTTGTQTLTVTYGGKKDTFSITVIVKRVTGITVSTVPAKTTYTQGEALDVTGGKITVTYNNGASEVIDMTSSMVTNFDSSVTGPRLLTVVYSGQETTYRVTVDCAHLSKTLTGAKKSNCQTQGNNAYYTCNNCSTVFKADGVTVTTIADEKLPLGSHTGGSANCSVRAICEVCKKAYGSFGKHTFTEQIEDEDHLVPGSGENCQSVKRYYYDCQICDTMGTESFDSVSTGDHAFTEKIQDEAHQVPGSGADCQHVKKYYYDCRYCDTIGTRVFNSSTKGEHAFTEKIEDEAHLVAGSGANCQSVKQYYYDCEYCGTVGTTSFDSTTTGNHTFTEKIEDEVHQVPGSGANCQSIKQYYYDCEYCDTTGTESFDSTAKGDHKMDTRWTTVNEKHYHKCTVDGCAYIEDEADCSGGSASCTEKAVCSECRQSYGTLVEHEYKAQWNQGNKDGHWHDCENCTAHDTQAAHNPGAEATEDTPQICTDCGYVVKAALGHTHSTTKVEGCAATCTQDGRKTYYTCACGKWFADEAAEDEITEKGSVVINALGHAPSGWKSDKNNHWKECTAEGCGTVIEDSKGVHKDSDNSGKCDVCGTAVVPAASDAPPTGDMGSILWFMLLLVSGSAAAVMIVLGKRRYFVK